MSVSNRTILSVASEFSVTPGPRFRTEGRFSGEEFREDFLVGKIQVATKKKDRLLVDLDGTAGYATSFLEEAFGGLVRKEGINSESLQKMLEFKSEEEPYLIDDIWTYIKDAGAFK